MSVTRSQIVSDVINRVTRSKPSDDLMLSRKLVSYWVDKERDELVTRKFEEDMRNAGFMDPFYTTQEECLAADVEGNACAEGCGIRYKIDITNDVLPMPRDMGVIRVVTNSNVIIHNSTEDEVRYFNDLPFAKPSFQNMMFYREGKEIFIAGLTSTMHKKVKFNVFYIPLGSSVLDTDPYPLSPELVSVLTENVEQIALRDVLGQYEDNVNDGKQ